MNVAIVFLVVDFTILLQCFILYISTQAYDRGILLTMVTLHSVPWKDGLLSHKKGVVMAGWIGLSLTKRDASVLEHGGRTPIDYYIVDYHQM